MKPDTLLAQLEQVCAEMECTGKGCLSVVLQVTRNAKKAGLPIDPAALVTDRKGQVRGL